MGARTKGCTSCKKRKVKCDLGRPKCSRCAAADIECKSFNQHIRFIDERPRIKRSLAVVSTQTAAYLDAINNSDLVDTPRWTDQSSLQILHSASCVPNTLPCTAFKDAMLLSYMLSKLFEQETHTTIGINCGLPKLWISNLTHTSKSEQQTAWNALAALVFGQAYQAHAILVDAHRLYGQALSSLRTRLEEADDHDRSSDGMLADVTALYTYEILACKASNGWLSHATGLEWLMELRGPWPQKPYAGKSIFLEHRIMLLAKAIITHQPSFLQKSIWKTVPWEDNPASKLPIDYLIDILADITDHASQLHALLNAKDTIRQKLEYDHLKSQITSSFQDLNEWWYKSAFTNPQTIIRVQNPNSMFPTRLQYTSLSTAFALCLYNSTRILLLQLWDKFNEHHDSTIPQHQPYLSMFGDTQSLLSGAVKTPLIEGLTSNTHTLATEILLSLSYSYNQSTQFINTFSFLFIKDIAYTCFAPDSEEARWLAEHGWAASDESSRGDANLLRRVGRLGQIRI